MVDYFLTADQIIVLFHVNLIQFPRLQLLHLLFLIVIIT